MSHRALFVETYIVGVALFGSLLVPVAAQAQGCCEGGSAYGANYWTAGNNWSGWGGAIPVFDPSWPVTAESEAGGLKDEPAPYWGTHGEIEIGGRAFVNNPNANGQLYGNTATGGYVHLDQQSLAKYYEYSIQPPGAFGGGHFAMGSSDGLYQLDFWANNAGSNYAGFSDQAYTLEISKAGEHYFSVSWDQTPNIYSTSALTPFQGVGTGNLTWPGAALPGGGSGNYANAGLYSNLHPIDLGIQRNTISFDYRWTPEFGEGGWKDGALSQYDFNANYSHMDRTGTQAAGVVELNGFNPTQVPAPVNDTTQNFGVNGERIGDTPWGKWTFKLGYSGSIYTDNLSSYTVQNPFLPTLGSCPAIAAGVGKSGSANCVGAQMSTPPSNSANGVSATATADLPFNTRYAGTFSYTSMTQNAPFSDMTNNPLATAAPGAYAGYNWNQINFGFTNTALTNRAYNLNGDIGTILSNNVLTTKITPDLTSKLTYRYYNFDNETPNIIFPNWVSYDGTGLKNPAPGSGGGSENAIGSLSPGYSKQDAGAELNWRPDREWNFNVAYGFERYDYQDADVTATNENSGKASLDWKPVSWFDARLSGSGASRRYENYNYDQNVVPTQFPSTLATVGGVTYTANTNYEYSPAYRQFMYDNRDQTKLNFVTDLVVLPNVTISPSFKYQDDNYGVNPNYNLGVSDNRSLSWGIDAVYVPHPDLSLFFSYYQESYNTTAYTTSCQPMGGHGACSLTPPSSGQVLPPSVIDPTAAPTQGQFSNLVTTNDKELVNTITAGVNYVAIPNKLTLDLRASVSDGSDSQGLGCAAWSTVALGHTFSQSCPGSLPVNNTLLEHIEANLIYKLDPELFGETVFKDAKLKLRYTWERNVVTNWQNDSLAPVTSSVSTGALWMDYNNPNYNVQSVSASLIVRW